MKTKKGAKKPVEKHGFTYYQRVHRERKKRQGFCTWHGCWKKRLYGRVFCAEHSKTEYHRAA